MNKKFFGVLLAVVLVVSQAVVSFAAPSFGGQMFGNGNTNAQWSGDFTDLISNEEVLSLIELINNTDSSMKDIIEAIKKITGIDLSGGSLITDFHKITGGTKSEDGSYKFTIEVPGLPDNFDISDVWALIFNQATDQWELVNPVSKDGKVLTFVTNYVPSAVAIYYKGVAVSPVTGVACSSTLTMGTAVAFAAVSALAFRKSKEE